MPPMIAPNTAPPPILVALLLPCDSPLICNGCTFSDEAAPAKKLFEAQKKFSEEHKMKFAQPGN